MKIFIICSKAFYDQIPKIKTELEAYGHDVSLPNCVDDPETESRMRQAGYEAHSSFKSKMFRQSEEEIKKQDAVLVLNFEKNNIPDYIGGATFLEMYDAFRLNKKIFLWNNIPSGILKDEIIGFNPILINGNLEKIQ